MDKETSQKQFERIKDCEGEFSDKKGAERSSEDQSSAKDPIAKSFEENLLDSLRAIVEFDEEEGKVEEPTSSPLLITTEAGNFLRSSGAF